MKQNWTRTLGATVALGLLGIALTMPSGVRTADAAGADELSSPSIFLRITGETQGPISGGSTDARCVDCLEVYGFAHEIVSPRDAASGLPTGKRQHKPVTLTKLVDKSTPLLYNALVNNENLPDFRLEFFRGNEKVPYYTIELLNASVADIQSLQSPGGSSPPRQSVAFTYQKIIWTWEDGGITAEDDWETPTA